MNGIEIEIKLAPVAPAQAERAFAWLAAHGTLSAPRDVTMRTSYYDTPDGALGRLGCMLRLRHEDGRAVCGFKASAGGLARLEAECEAPSVEQGAAVLARRDDLPPDAYAPLRAGVFVRTAGAAFTRRRAVFTQGDFACEVAYDAGELLGGRAAAPFTELELELLRGGQDALRALARALCDECGLCVCAVPKHARALALREDAQAR